MYNRTCSAQNYGPHFIALGTGQVRKYILTPKLCSSIAPMRQTSVTLVTGTHISQYWNNLADSMRK